MGNEILKDHLIIDYGRPASFEKCLLRFERVGFFPCMASGIHICSLACLGEAKETGKNFRWVLDESHYLSIYLVTVS